MPPTSQISSSEKPCARSVPKSSSWISSLRAWAPDNARSAPRSFCGRNVSGRHFCAGAEKMLLHLLGQPFPGAGIGERKAILVDEHRLMLQPLLPRLLRDVLVEALAELARIRRKIEPFRFAAELHAFHHSCHRNPL